MRSRTPAEAGPEAVDRYLAAQPPAQRAALEAVRATLRKVLPHADEGLKYGMPAFVLDGKGVAGYAGFTNHCSYFPMSGKVIAAAGEAIAGYERSTGGFRFGVDERLPMALVRHLVRLRLAELSDVTNGKRVEYFADGRVKARGQMRDGRPHGAWRWFRSDGTLRRTGRYAHGERTGTWTTFDRDGEPVRTTSY